MSVEVGSSISSPAKLSLPISSMLLADLDELDGTALGKILGKVETPESGEHARHSSHSSHTVSHSSWVSG